jgi:hypothetical protein
MAYNEDLDKVLFDGNIESEDGTVLKVSVYSYNGGDPKLQIGPREYTKKNGDKGYRKAGRMTAGELEKLVDMLPDLQIHLGAETLPVKA